MNGVDIIISSCFCWLGWYFCPVLSVLTLLNIGLTFYSKWMSIAFFCLPPKEIVQYKFMWSYEVYFWRKVPKTCSLKWVIWSDRSHVGTKDFLSVTCESPITRWYFEHKKNQINLHKISSFLIIANSIGFFISVLLFLILPDAISTAARAPGAMWRAPAREHRPVCKSVDGELDFS